MFKAHDQVKVVWGFHKGMEGEIVEISGKNVSVMLAVGFVEQLSTDHIEALENELVGQTFEKVVNALTSANVKPNTKAFETIRNMIVKEIKEGTEEFILYGDHYTRRVDGIQLKSRRFCRVRKTGASLQKKLGTQWTVTM